MFYQPLPKWLSSVSQHNQSSMHHLSVFRNPLEHITMLFMRLKYKDTQPCKEVFDMKLFKGAPILYKKLATLFYN